MLRFTLTTATIVLILMAAIIPFTKEPPVEAQTTKNTILEQKTVIQEMALQEQLDKTSKALDEVPTPKKIKTVIKAPAKEVIYFRKDGKVFEKEFIRQDGMLIIDLDSMLLWCNGDSKDVDTLGKIIYPVYRGRLTLEYIAPSDSATLKFLEIEPQEQGTVYEFKYSDIQPYLNISRRLIPKSIFSQ